VFVGELNPTVVNGSGKRGVSKTYVSCMHGDARWSQMETDGLEAGYEIKSRTA